MDTHEPIRFKEFAVSATGTHNITQFMSMNVVGIVDNAIVYDLASDTDPYFMFFASVKPVYSIAAARGFNCYILTDGENKYAAVSFYYGDSISSGQYSHSFRPRPSSDLRDIVLDQHAKQAIIQYLADNAARGKLG